MFRAFGKAPIKRPLVNVFARRLLVQFGILLLFAAPVSRGRTGEHASANHVLVKFRDTPIATASVDSNPLTALLGELKLPTGAKLREPSFPRPKPLSAASPQKHKPHFFYLDLPPGFSVDDCLARLKNHPSLEYAEPDGIGAGGGALLEIIPDDLDFDFQWHHRNTLKPSASIHTPEAWAMTTGSSNVVVAVLDTGVNMSLPKFAGRILPGYNFVADTADPTDDHGHGTAVASTLCAADDGAGGVGVDWRCKLMPVKVMDDSNIGLYSWWAQGIDFAVANGAKVINLSGGGPGESITLRDAIQRAIAAGVIFVTITHNYGAESITFPGSMPDAITVGATGRDDARCAFSDYGPQIDLVAPGNEIYTTGRFNRMEAWEGTSFAAPQVSGVAALLCAIRPALNQFQVRALLCNGADDRVGGATDTQGFDDYYGEGRLNAMSSLLLAKTRIEKTSFQNGKLTLSWTAPQSSANKRSFEVYFQPLASETWSLVGDSNSISYLDSRASWTAPASAPGLYQIRLR